MGKRLSIESVTFDINISNINPVVAVIMPKTIKEEFVEKSGNVYRCMISALCTLILCLLSGNAGGTTIVLNPTDDTFIDQYAPNSVNGALNYLLARRGNTGYTLNTLVRFDLSAIPSTTTINSAKLGLYYWHYNDGDPVGKELTAHIITSSWSEGTATWNNQPPFDPVPMAFDTVPGSYGWMEWNVTDNVRAIVNLGLTNSGIEIIDPATSGGFPMIYFFAKENGAFIPYLEIDTSMTAGWYWKPPYPNYAPTEPGGMPDFDMKQDNWMSIYPGLNGVIDAAVAGDDVYDPITEMIGPGPDCHLDSDPVGDDYADWSFSGPAALANCFWWFDSKYADTTGYPGDNLDIYPLVQGYPDSTGKTVDQEHTTTDLMADIPSSPPGHVQSFTPMVAVLDAVQLLLWNSYEYTPTNVEVSIYNTFPDNAGVVPLGISTMAVSGPSSNQWYQFHFSPRIDLDEYGVYYIGVRIIDGDGVPHWCYDTNGGYTRGQAWFNWGEPYVLYPNDGVNDSCDFNFKTEYYTSAVFDDHEADNVPHLIKDLADRMTICSSGKTDVYIMQDVIEGWLLEKGLGGDFIENTYEAPDFHFIEEEIERSQDVILQLGFYVYDSATKIVDQEHTVGNFMADITPYMPGHLQSFTPTVTVLDAVQLLIGNNYEYTPTDVEVSIYDQLPTDPSVMPLGSSIMSVSGPFEPDWYQFHFEFPIDLNPEGEYFIGVVVLQGDGNPHWYYDTLGQYPYGQAWFCWSEPYVLYPDDGWNESCDFAFRTEYYGEAECIKWSEQFVTCTGVNSDLLMIAFSDPRQNMANPADLDHNDAQNVSHDIYAIVEGSPCPELPYLWWIPDFPVDWDFTIIENAVVICPVEDSCDCEPGNCNGDVTINIFDITYLIAFLYKAGPAPVPYALCSGDPTCDCLCNIFDVTHLISFLYKGGPPPCTCLQWLAACGSPLRK